MNIKNIDFIYHYYEKKVGPFKNISALPYDQAKKRLQSITKGFNKNRGDDYLDKRLVLESQLKKAFITKGGKPKRNDPFYFTLGECKWLETWYEEAAIVKIPIHYLFEHKDIISFTYPDSMISFQLAHESQLSAYKKSCNGQVYTLQEIEEIINTFGMPNPAIWSKVELHQFDRYIEIQVWGDSFILEYL